MCFQCARRYTWNFQFILLVQITRTQTFVFANKKCYNLLCLCVYVSLDYHHFHRKIIPWESIRMFLVVLRVRPCVYY